MTVAVLLLTVVVTVDVVVVVVALIDALHGYGTLRKKYRAEVFIARDNRGRVSRYHCCRCRRRRRRRRRRDASYKGFPSTVPLLSAAFGREREALNERESDTCAGVRQGIRSQVYALNDRMTDKGSADS